MRSLRSIRTSTLLCGLLLGSPLLLAGRVGAERTDAVPTPKDAVAVVKAEKGFIDDAFALSADGTVLFYVNTDGASWASLRAVGLPARTASPATPATQSSEAPAAPAASAAVAYPPLRAAGSGSAATHTPPTVTPRPPVSTFSIEPGTSSEVLSALPLSITKIALLPDDRVLVVMRDLESLGVVNGAVYSLRSRSAQPIPGITGGTLGPVSEITVGDGPSGPVIVTYNRPPSSSGAPGSEYSISAYSAVSLKLVGSHSYKLRDDGRIPTSQGSAIPLYFVDSYQTLVAKHDGLFDKKRDSRQPDFLAFIDALTGRVRRSHPITDPNGVMELGRLHKDHSESQFPIYDPESQKIELVALNDHAATDATQPVDRHSELQLPRPNKLYDGATLRYQLLRPGRLLLSLTVDPVNEQAIAQRRSDPDDIDFCLVDPAAPAGLRKLRTIPGYRRPTEWAASASGRLVLLRKHKNYPRGGPEVEVYDLDL